MLLWTHEYINIFNVLLYNWFHNMLTTILKFFTPLAHLMIEATDCLHEWSCLCAEFWIISVSSQMVSNLQSVYCRVTLHMNFINFRITLSFGAFLQMYDIDKYDRISSCASSNRWILLLTESLNYWMYLKILSSGFFPSLLFSWRIFFLPCMTS